MPSPRDQAVKMSRVAAVVTRDPVPPGGRRKHGPAPWRAVRNGLPVSGGYVYRGTGHDSIPLPEFTGRGRCDCGQKWCPAKPSQPRRTRKDSRV